MPNFSCIDLRGTIYQPDDVLDIGGYWVIPSSQSVEKRGAAVHEDAFLFLATDKHLKKFRYEISNFVMCYQFLFSDSSAYYHYEELLRHRKKKFQQRADNIGNLKDAIQKEHGSGFFIIDFNNIDTFHTALPVEVNFRNFHSIFIDRYNNDSNFKNMANLFLSTIGSDADVYKPYRNVYRNIAQLQTIFEAITGKPPERIESCGKRHYTGTWIEFIQDELPKIGVRSTEEVSLIMRVKTILNRAARIKYIHNVDQHDTERQITDDVLSGRVTNSSPDINTILNKKTKEWTGLDWKNLYSCYAQIVKVMIYNKYLQT